MPNDHGGKHDRDADRHADHHHCSDHGFDVTLHPAFASRCAVRSADGTVKEVYRQDGVFQLRGKNHPQKHCLRIMGGEHGRDLEIEIRDPKHHVARIIVELYPAGRTPGTGLVAQPVETIELENNVATCPPLCGDNDEPPL